MEKMIFDYPASATKPVRAHVGVVASGDLEILLEPSRDNGSHVSIQTSVAGFANTWKAVLDRFFERYNEAANIDIRDFGATPGTVALRLQQVVEVSRSETFIWLPEEIDKTELSKEVLALSSRRSYIEMNARARATQLLDPGTFRELLGPFDHVESPWLPMQGIVPQSDDGCVVAKGMIDANPAVVIAMEGKFQGGSIGEVCGMKIAQACALARQDNEQGIPTRAVISLESGGVRLQEANMGELVIAEIYSEIVALRKHIPVIVVIAGNTGCFGGMSLVAGLASYVIMTRQARLSMNGPEVIELEAGLSEFKAGDKPFVWSVCGGAQRHATGFADVLVEDDAVAISDAVKELFRKGQPDMLRTSKHELFIERLAELDTTKQWIAEDIRNAWKDGAE